MVEQKVIIKLFNEDNGDHIGDLFLLNQNKKEIPRNSFSTERMKFHNVEKTLEPDDETPIQYSIRNPIGLGARLMLLEETKYDILFRSKKDIQKKKCSFYDIEKIRDKSVVFDEFKLNLDPNSYGGTINFHSYVGKSFFNIVIEDENGRIKTKSHPFDVRSKKIGYQDQYRDMISDLSKASSSLLLEPGAPLYQYFDFDEKERKTVNENFMFLEYIFNPDNLPRNYEYIRKNLYNRLEKRKEKVPTSMADCINPNDLVGMISSSDNLVKSKHPPKQWPEKMLNFVPLEIDREFCEETIDTPENRLLKHLLLSLDSLITKTYQYTEPGYVKDKLIDFKSQISDYLADGWLLEVGELEYIPSNSQVLQKKEGYRDIFQYYLNFEFAFRMQWEEMDDLLKGYNRKLSELYEYWCYFKMVKVLGEITGDSKNFNDLFERTGEGDWKIRLKRGNKSILKFNYYINGSPVILIFMYNKRFSRKTKHPSYSLPFKPDYSIYLETTQKNCFIHFDAKYRSEGEVLEFYDKIGEEPIKKPHDETEETFNDPYDSDDEKEIKKRDKDEEILRKYKDGDIYKMHTYKDAILKTEGAYILYPGDRNKIFREEDLEDIPSVGAFPLTPGKDGEERIELEKFIRRIILNKLI